VNKKIVLVGRDAAPSGCFERLEPILKRSGFEVCLFANKGKPLLNSVEEVILAVSSADVVILGMSSSPKLAQYEIVAGESAKRAGVSYGFYGDTPRCWARARKGAWFEQLAQHAAFYFGVTQADADLSVEVFPNAQLVFTGNPLREEIAFSRFTREEVRTKLDITQGEKLVLAAGGKLTAGNMASWVLLMDALASLAKKGQCFQLIFAIHPGDRTPYAVDTATQSEMRLYDELVSLSPVPTRIVGKNLLTTSDIVPGADIIVEFGTSIGIEGAYHDVPVVSLGFEILFRRLEQISGTRTLEVVESGLSELIIADVRKLTDTIDYLLTPSGFAEMYTKKQKFHPKSTERSIALRKITEAILKIVKE